MYVILQLRDKADLEAEYKDWRTLGPLHFFARL
jgi:hypothetical protein